MVNITLDRGLTTNLTQIAPFSLLSAADGVAYEADSAAPLAGDLGKPGSPQERWLYLLTGASEGPGWEERCQHLSPPRVQCTVAGPLAN